MGTNRYYQKPDYTWVPVDNTNPFPHMPWYQVVAVGAGMIVTVALGAPATMFAVMYWFYGLNYLIDKYNPWVIFG